MCRRVSFVAAPPSDLAHTAFAAKDAIDACLKGEHLATKMYKHLLKHKPKEKKGE